MDNKRLKQKDKRKHWPPGVNDCKDNGTMASRASQRWILFSIPMSISFFICWTLNFSSMWTTIILLYFLVPNMAFFPHNYYQNIFTYCNNEVASHPHFIKLNTTTIELEPYSNYTIRSTPSLTNQLLQIVNACRCYDCKLQTISQTKFCKLQNACKCCECKLQTISQTKFWKL